MILDKWDFRVADVVEVGKTFMNESNYNLTFSEKRMLDALYCVILDSDGDIIVDYNDNVLNGFAVLQRTDECHEEYLGYLNKFYVRPEKRLTKTSIRLMKEVTAWFDDKECVYSFANSMAMIGHDEAFIKLMEKFNYIETPYGGLIRGNDMTNLFRKPKVHIPAPALPSEDKIPAPTALEDTGADVVIGSGSGKSGDAGTFTGDSTKNQRVSGRSEVRKKKKGANVLGGTAAQTGINI